MSSSSSSPRETYEEDREYESQAKRLKTEEGEIDYSAEEGENRREATPRGGGDGGGRSFSQPVTKRGAPSARPPAVPWRLPGKQGPVAGTGSGPPARRFPSRLRGPSGRLASRGAFLMGPTCVPHPDRGPGPGLAAGPGARRRPALNLERVREGRRGGVASARGASGRAELFVS